MENRKEVYVEVIARHLTGSVFDKENGKWFVEDKSRVAT